MENGERVYCWQRLEYISRADCPKVTSQGVTMDLQIVGLFYDVAGIFVLGINSVIRVAEQTERHSATMWNGNKALREWLVQSRIDTAAGSTLLLSGFLFQVASLYEVSWPSTILRLVLVILVLLLLFYWGFIRLLATKHYLAKIDLLSQSN